MAKARNNKSDRHKNLKLTYANNNFFLNGKIHEITIKEYII